MNTATNTSSPLQETRTRLLRLRESLLAGIRDDLHSVLGGPDAAGTIADDFERPTEALREEELAIHLARMENGAAGLAAVKAALAALDNGTYGICRDCGEAIGANRLASNPVADRCLACAASHEKSSA